MSDSAREGSRALAVQDLVVRYGENVVVHGVSFEVHPGERVALVGESGSGKSTIGRSILGLLPPGGVIASGSVDFEDSSRGALGSRGELGLAVGLVFQDPSASMDPLRTIGSQVGEAVRAHSKTMHGAKLKQRIVELLALAGLPEPEQLLSKRPHELSGGMRQRVLIAAAIAHNPRVLIADEPTSALDVRTQAAVLDLLRDLSDRLAIALVLITHDLGVVRQVCDRVLVLHNGMIEESGTVDTVFKEPSSEYTRSLLRAIIGAKARRTGPELPEVDSDQQDVVLDVSDVAVAYGRNRPILSDISFSVRRGETIGIVGESGAGKTTLGRALVRLLETGSGKILVDGADFGSLRRGRLREARRDVQMVFQDPFTAMDPRLSVRQILAQPLTAHRLRGQRTESQMVEMLREMDLSPDLLSRRINQLSGGQQQRVAVARALVLSPKVVVLDEPTSALDASVRMKVLDLLRREQLKSRAAFVFITHDLAAARYFCDRIAVLKAGRFVEMQPATRIFAMPEHPYTAELIAATPQFRESCSASDCDGAVAG